ncbi:MAG TPA: hypothetical protein DCY52_10720 [Methylococcaceae bacterium]|nr:hypothetical protein [Methylococcaceae bacterium]
MHGSNYGGQRGIKQRKTPNMIDFCILKGARPLLLSSSFGHQLEPALPLVSLISLTSRQKAWG